MYNSNQNYISAKQYIIWAFMDLLGSKSFEVISVKEIVKKAGISRSTFYLHFQDKFELMEFIRENITSKFLSFYDFDQKEKETATSLISTTTINICQHIFEFRNFYQYEFDNPKFIQELSNALALKLFQVYSDKSYAIFASFGTIGYLTFWVKDNFQISPQEAAKQLMKIGMTDWSKYNAK